MAEQGRDSKLSHLLVHSKCLRQPRLGQAREAGAKSSIWVSHPKAAGTQRPESHGCWLPGCVSRRPDWKQTTSSAATCCATECKHPTRPLGPASHTALGPGLASCTALDPSAPWACSQFHSVLQDPWAEQGQGEASMPGWAPGAVRWDSPECPPPLKGAKGAPGSQAGQVAKLSFEPSVRLHSTLPCSSGPCLPHGTPDMLGAGGQRLLTHPCMLQTRRPVLTGHHTSP